MPCEGPPCVRRSSIYDVTGLAARSPGRPGPRARVPLDVLRDVIQPFPTFSEIYVDALKALRGEITAARQAVTAGPS